MDAAINKCGVQSLPTMKQHGTSTQLKSRNTRFRPGWNSGCEYRWKPTWRMFSKRILG